MYAEQLLMVVGVAVVAVIVVIPVFGVVVIVLATVQVLVPHNIGAGVLGQWRRYHILSAQVRLWGDDLRRRSAQEPVLRCRS